MLFDLKMDIYIYIYLFATLIGQWNELNYIYVYVNMYIQCYCGNMVHSVCMGFATWTAGDIDQFCVFSTDAGRKNDSSKHSFRSNMWGILF